jgi:hypothetical protein
LGERRGEAAPPASPAPAEISDGVAAAPDRHSQQPGFENGAASMPPPQSAEDDAPPPIDEAAESAFLAEARDRGETVRPAPAADVIDETDSKELPPLDTLVQRIPADVRETLEELFRAKFIRVQRVPKKALKS